MSVVAIVNSYRVLLVDFADIIVHAFVFLEVEVDMCRFLRYFSRDTGLNDVIVHELMCNV